MHTLCQSAETGGVDMHIHMQAAMFLMVGNGPEQAVSPLVLLCSQGLARTVTACFK